MLKKDCRKNAFKCTRQPFLVLWVVLLSSRFPACFSISGKSKKRVHVLNLERVNSKKLGSKATVSRTYLILILLCIDEAIYLTLLCKGKKVVRRKGILFLESQLSCFSQRKLSLTLFRALPLHL